jgi:hypothetical protein
LARFIYEKQFTVLFITKNLDMANALCRLWQKIGPLPHFSNPERWSLKKDEMPPETCNWKTMQWMTKGLSQMILKRKVFNSKFDQDVDNNGSLRWLDKVSTPTAAMVVAHERLTTISCTRGPAPYNMPTDLLGF